MDGGDNSGCNFYHPSVFPLPIVETFGYICIP